MTSETLAAAAQAAETGAHSAKQRDTNLELFRILAMLLIIAHHYVVNSELMSAESPLITAPTADRSIALYLFAAWGKTGINCFVLITGYFMCKSAISAKKFAKLYFEVLFYILVINGFFWLRGDIPFSPGYLLAMLLPTTGLDTSFTGTYLLFFLCIPYLNILVRNMTQKQHVYLLVLLIAMYVVMGTLKLRFTVTMNYVSWFCVVYILSSYVRLYPNGFFANTRLWGAVMVLFIAASACSVVKRTWIWGETGSGWSYDYVMDCNTFLAVGTGFSAFMFFKNLKVKYNPFINTLASTCFGVLLIHANGEAMRSFLWGELLNNAGAYHKPWMPLHAVGSVVGVFLVCAGIDYLRIIFVERPFFRLWDRWWPKIAEAYAKLESAVFHKLGISMKKSNP